MTEQTTGDFAKCASELVTTPGSELAVILGRPMDQNPAAVYVTGLAPGSRRTMTGALAKIAYLLSGGSMGADVFPWASLRFQHTAAVRAELMACCAPAGANKALAALRGTLKAAWRLGQMTAEEYQRATDLDNVKGDALMAGRALTSGEIAALMASCENDPSPAGARDAALFAVLLTCGLRREELVNLDFGDCDPTTGALTVRSGKGAQGRIGYCLGGCADALADWLAIRGDKAGALFWPILGGGRVTERRMTAQAVLLLCRRRGKAAGIRPFSPHDLRRTFVTGLLDAGVDTLIVSKLAGHADPATTARYDRRPEEAKREGAGRLFIPYRRRML